MSTSLFNKFITALLMITLLTGCGVGFSTKPTATPLPPTATSTPVPRTLTICLGMEPDSLYPYGSLSPASTRVWEVIYSGAMKTRDGLLTSQILERIPSLESGDMVLEAVEVKNGDEVVDADGNLTTLAAGLSVFPHGCTSAECVQTWDGVTPLQLDRLKINFQLKENLKWSDGQPVTAADSVYSFEVASDPATPVAKNEVDLTKSYTAVNEKTVQWVGKPGYLTTHLEKILWLPLPKHLWNQFSAAQLLKSSEPNRQPVGWGAYVIQSWTSGQAIHMVKNPYYFRAAEGLPKFDFLNFVFLDSAENPVEAVKTGKCDLVDSTAVSLEHLPTVMESQKSNQINAIIYPGSSMEMLALGIKPVSYDNSYFPFGTDRPAYFDDLRTRQAMAACIDRQKIIEKFLSGAMPIPAGVSTLYESETSGQFSAQLFDLPGAEELLTAAGWQDYDQNPATPRIAVNVKNVPNGRALSVSLLSSDSPWQKLIAAEIAESLTHCGFSVSQNQLPSEELYQPAPEGPVFGRKFDLALVSLAVGENSDCQLFDSREIPTQLNYWLGKSSGGMNFTGYSNADVDASCLTAGRSGLDANLAAVSRTRINQLINQELPVIPLFHQPAVTIFRKELCGFEKNTQNGFDFSTLDQWDAGTSCPE